jgi:hypothetical protein
MCYVHCISLDAAVVVLDAGAWWLVDGVVPLLQQRKRLGPNLRRFHH